MYKRLCALFCLTISLCSYSHIANNNNSQDSQSFFSRVYSFVVESFNNGISYICSLFPDNTRAETHQLEHESPNLQTTGSLDELAQAEDDSYYCYDMTDDDQLEAYGCDSREEFSAVDTSEEPQSLTEADLAQLLEQLQQALGESEQESWEQEPIDSTRVCPTSATLHELIQELENAPVVCLDNEQSEF